MRCDQLVQACQRFSNCRNATLLQGFQALVADHESIGHDGCELASSELHELLKKLQTLTLVFIALKMRIVVVCTG